jgi:dTDP-4-amino-4,6-dideoxygalactose transaminase
MKLKNIKEYSNPFDAVTEFENTLSAYTNAPFVVTTDCCTHAIELCFRYKQAINECPDIITIPNKTYVSVPMTFRKLNIEYQLINSDWRSEYNFGCTNVWDSARCLRNTMYLPGQMQCLSFGRTKPMEIGRGGAILLDNEHAFKWLKKASYDGRDLYIHPWQDQVEFEVGYHYMMRPEEAVDGLNILTANKISNSYNYCYPDLSKLNISRNL